MFSPIFEVGNILAKQYDGKITMDKDFFVHSFPFFKKKRKEILQNP